MPKKTFFLFSFFFYFFLGFLVFRVFVNTSRSFVFRNSVFKRGSVTRTDFLLSDAILDSEKRALGFRE